METGPVDTKYRTQEPDIANFKLEQTKNNAVKGQPRVTIRHGHIDRGEEKEKESMNHTIATQHQKVKN